MSTDVPDLTRFGPDEAWRLGSRLVEACRRCALPVAINVRRSSFMAGSPEGLAGCRKRKNGLAATYNWAMVARTSSTLSTSVSTTGGLPGR